MISYKWSIDKLQVAEDNLVVKAEWRVTATQDDLTASAAGTQTLVRGDSFIPYEQLTEQQVLDWCFPTVKDEGEAQVAGQIARQLAKKTSEPALPWMTI
jgi:hypothetical protein